MNKLVVASYCVQYPQRCNTWEISKNIYYIKFHRKMLFTGILKHTEKFNGNRMIDYVRRVMQLKYNILKEFSQKPTSLFSSNPLARYTRNICLI